MRDGLKKTLLFITKTRGEISIDDIADICREEHYKTATAERRLRELCEDKGGTVIPELEPIWDKDETYIIGYRPFSNLEQTTLNI